MGKEVHLRYKRYKYSSSKADIKRIYEEAFPTNEKFPFYILRICSSELNIHLDGIQVDDMLIGMQFIVEYDDVTYLMYFAIDEKYRNLGYGSKTLKNLIIRNENVLLCIEKPCGIHDIKSKRKDFYLRNGFHETGVFIIDAGVEYEILTSVKGYVPTISILEKRYNALSNNPIIQYIIRHTFDSEIKIIS